MATIEQDRTQPLSREQVSSIIIGLMMAMFPGALDATIVAPAMPTIGRELGNAENLPWIVTAYLLMSTASTPLYGKLSDIHGRRIMLLTAISIFAFGSLLCALAPTMILLAVARAVQGIGGGGLVSLAITIIGDIVPLKERPRYQVYTSIMWTASSLAGPIIGGYVAEMFHWSVIFWINLPLCLLAYLLTDNKLKRLPRHERPHKLDFAGAAVLIIASLLLQLALTWGGVRYPWTSPVILGLFAAACIASAILVWRLISADEPLIPLALFSNRAVLTAAMSVALVMGVYMGLTIYTPIFFESGMGLSAGQSGLALLPLMVFTTFGAMISGRLMMSIKRYRLIPMIGQGIAALALVPLFFSPLDHSLWTIEILFAINAVGVGTAFPVSMITVQNAVPFHQLGTATSIVSFMRNFGAAFGVAAFGAIAIGGGAVSSGDAASVALSGDAFGQVFRWIFFASTLGLAISVFTFGAMKESPLVDRRRATPGEDPPH
jgi:EmrB/QacA subfamily drug resistance transporter